jgi:dolichyl-phosphate beta-glucosyltransferase
MYPAANTNPNPHCTVSMYKLVPRSPALRYTVTPTPPAQTNPHPPDLSIVIPAFNPGSRLTYLLGDITSVMVRARLTAQVIVVDDGSTDVAAALTSKDSITVLRGPNQGKGAALRAGLAAASAPMLAILDADGAYSATTLLALYDVALTHHAAVVGRRPFARSPRGVASKLFSSYVRLVHGLRCDTQAGIKVFSAELYQDLAPYLTTTGFAFDVDLLSLARQRHWPSPAEFPVVPNPTISSSNVTPTRIARALYDVALLRLSYPGPTRQRPPVRKLTAPQGPHSS